MQFDTPPLTGQFLRRYKRFFADIELPSGEVITAHCPNTGSLLGCKESGAPAWLRDSGNDKRKLRYTWQAIEVDGTWVNVDTGIPNRVVFEAIRAGKIRPLAGYREARREVKYGQNSRIDVLLEGHPSRPSQRCYVEVKNTTLARGRVGLFPDAVTERGRKHLGELEAMVAQGHRSVQLFFVSRSDVTTFLPADDIDPKYAAALRQAAQRGVEVLAYRARVTPQAVEIERKLRVKLG